MAGETVVPVYLELGRKRVFAVAARRAEFAYARKVGVRHRGSSDPAAVAAIRGALLEVLAAGPAEPLRGKGWPLRYAVRRTAWHVLDHAWEIEDRGPTG